MEPDYRPVSTLASVSLAFSTASLIGFLIPQLAYLSVAACVFSAFALYSLGLSQSAGQSLVRISLILSMVGLVVAPVFHLQRYQSETLPHCQRVSFIDLFRQDNTTAFLGQSICLKGYREYPHTGQQNPQQMTGFWFSPDGQSSDVQHMVFVQIAYQDPSTYVPLSVSGQLVQIQREDGTWVFCLRAEKVSPVYFPDQLAPRRNSC